MSGLTASWVSGGYVFAPDGSPEALHASVVLELLGQRDGRRVLDLVLELALLRRPRLHLHDGGLVLDQRAVLLVLLVREVVVLLGLLDLVVHLVVALELRVPRNVELPEALDQLVHVFLDFGGFRFSDCVRVEVRLLQLEVFHALRRPESHEVFSPLGGLLARLSALLLGLLLVHGFLALFSAAARGLEGRLVEGGADADDFEVSEPGEVQVLLAGEPGAAHDAPEVQVLALLTEAYVAGEFEALHEHLAALLLVVHLERDQVFELERELQQVAGLVERDHPRRVRELAREEQREHVAHLLSHAYLFALARRHFGQVLDDRHSGPDALRAQDRDGRQPQLVKGPAEGVRVRLEFLEVDVCRREHGADDVGHLCAVHHFEQVSRGRQQDELLAVELRDCVRQGLHFARSMVTGRVCASMVCGGTSSPGASPK